MDVGDNVGVEDVKLLVVVALDGREGLVQEVADCLLLGWINLEIQHAFAPRNSIKNVGKEYVEADCMLNVEPLSMHMFSVDNRNKVNTR